MFSVSARLFLGMARTMNVFCDGISGDIPSRKREIGRRQGKKEPADAENMVKYPG